MHGGGGGAMQEHFQIRFIIKAQLSAITPYHSWKYIVIWSEPQTNMDYNMAVCIFNMGNLAYFTIHIFGIMTKIRPHGRYYNEIILDSYVGPCCRVYFNTNKKCII